MQEEEYWQAVLQRDKQADGEFVYAVRSTGIYCKPTCPSRKPSREQVAFFEQTEAAEQAGFRACRRCQSESKSDVQVELIQKACRLIEQHLDEPLRLEQFAAEIGLSPSYAQRLFKRVMGISPRQYAEAQRLERVKSQLKGDRSVTSTVYEAGYSSSSRFYERTPEQLGMTPTVYKRGGAGMHINYTIADSPLGRLLVAATRRGVCHIGLHESDEVLEGSLKHEYPAAEIQLDQTGLGLWVEVLIQHLRGQQPHLDLPIDIRATAFQWRVWQELCAIPYGETRSYSEIASAIGHPTARRAVAQACAHNPVPLIVPCHRVVRSDGGQGGYRWGVERKSQLLEQEAATKPEEARTATH